MEHDIRRELGDEFHHALAIPDVAEPSLDNPGLVLPAEFRPLEDGMQCRLRMVEDENARCPKLCTSQGQFGADRASPSRDDDPLILHEGLERPLFHLYEGT